MTDTPTPLSLQQMTKLASENNVIVTARMSHDTVRQVLIERNILLPDGTVRQQ